ncbi:hypothetical protein DFQ27_009652, partial [Actinomortierella ambigua]
AISEKRADPMGPFEFNWAAQTLARDSAPPLGKNKRLVLPECETRTSLRHLG